MMSAMRRKWAPLGGCARTAGPLAVSAHTGTWACDVRRMTRGVWPGRHCATLPASGKASGGRLPGSLGRRWHRASRCRALGRLGRPAEPAGLQPMESSAASVFGLVSRIFRKPLISKTSRTGGAKAQSMKRPPVCWARLASISINLRPALEM